MVRLASLHAALLVALTAAPAAAGPIDPPIVGGSRAGNCEWPSAVLLDNGFLICTGTLVSPWIVLYAAHCGVDFEQVVFGEGFGAGYFTLVRTCRRVTEFDEVGPSDYAYCELQRPITGVPIAPVLTGCESEILTPGQNVAIVGFGQDDMSRTGSKRWASTTYRGIDTDDTLLVGGDGTGASFGDSGGPAFVQLDDGSWRAFGIVSGGPAPGEPVSYVDMSTTVSWVERTSGHDITPCHTADGTWEPGFDCGGFGTEPRAGGDWELQCSDRDPLSGRSSTCGEARDGDPEDPEVAILSPEDGAVVDLAPSELTVEVDASDATSAVRHVWLEIDGDVREIDKEEPWSFTGNFEQGHYTLAVFAEDEGGNIARSAEHDLYVGEEPGGCLGCRTGGGRGGLGSLLVAALTCALWRLTCRGRSRPRR
jgi:hypothetical protein